MSHDEHNYDKRKIMLRQQNCFQALILWFGWNETIPITCSHSITASQSNFNRIDKIKR